MKYLSLFFLLSLIIGLSFLYLYQNKNKSLPQTTVLATGLDTPWSIAFLPDNNILITERPGTLKLLDTKGNLSLVSTIEKVKEIGEGGLLGITLHPHFSTNHYIYLYYTYSSNGDNTLNRVVRMTYEDQKLTDERIIVDSIPGASNHNGGRIKFGSDNYLYITTGDAENPSQAQDKNALGGKILRVTDGGEPAPGNSFQNRVFSYGHRNPQGLAWDSQGQLWETEHGPSGLETGNDEVNTIESGKNYGWPTIRGTQTREGMVSPIIESGFGNAWAPGSLAYLNGNFYFSGLKGQTLYKFDPNSKKLSEYLNTEYGRIREVITGPDGMLYITTSNKDGRGVPEENDDKVIRVNPEKL